MQYEELSVLRLRSRNNKPVVVKARPRSQRSPTIIATPPRVEPVTPQEVVKSTAGATPGKTCRFDVLSLTGFAIGYNAHLLSDSMVSGPRPGTKLSFETMGHIGFSPLSDESNHTDAFLLALAKAALSGNRKELTADQIKFIDQWILYGKCLRASKFYTRHAFESHDVGCATVAIAPSDYLETKDFCAVDGEHVVFGDLPYGLKAIVKARWLTFCAQSFTADVHRALPSGFEIQRTLVDHTKLVAWLSRTYFR